MDQNNYIFEVEDLCKYFPAGKKKVVTVQMYGL